MIPMTEQRSETRERHRQYKNPETTHRLTPEGVCVGVQVREAVVEQLGRRGLIEQVQRGLDELGLDLAAVERFVVPAGGPLGMLDEVLDVLASFDESVELSASEMPAVSEREAYDAAVLTHEVLVVRPTAGPSPSPATSPDGPGLVVVAVAPADEASE